MRRPDGTVELNLPENDVRFLLFLMRQQQDECRKINQDYPRQVYVAYRELDVRLEQIKMKVANQL